MMINIWYYTFDRLGNRNKVKNLRLTGYKQKDNLLKALNSFLANICRSFNTSYGNELIFWLQKQGYHMTISVLHAIQKSSKYRIIYLRWEESMTTIRKSRMIVFPNVNEGRKAEEQG